MNEFKEIFSNKPGRTSIYVHQIRLNNNEPFKPRTYPIPVMHKEKVRKKIEEMMQWKIIRRSETPYISPLVPIVKRDGSVRVCLDAQSLNKKIDMDYESPLPTEHLLYQYNKSMFFSTLDLTSSFWQVELSEDSTKYCGFLFDNKVYEFLVMPFGLKTAVAGMSRCINLLFNDYDYVSSYIDDILIASTTEEEHYIHLRRVFEKLREANLTVNLAKCKFLRKEIPFLGHILTTEGIKIDNSKMDIIKNYKRPNNVRSLRGFLGVCNYHRRFCAKYTDILYPLYNLLKKGTKWQWKEEHEVAFNLAKEAIIKASVLYHPDLSKEFHMETDASATAVAGRLFQVIDNIEYNIAYHSRKLSQAEMNYTTTERELLSIIECLLKWKYIVMASRITIWTDHKSLTFLLKCQLLNPRLARWYLKIQSFDITLKYFSGSENMVADTLSRLSCEDSDKNQIEIATAQILRDKQMVSTLKNLKNSQIEDPRLRDIIQNVTNGNCEQGEYRLFKGILFQLNRINKMWKVCIPDALKDDLIKYYHEQFGHFGVWKTFKSLSLNYAWRNMRDSIKKVIKGCELCQRSKISNQAVVGRMEAIIPRDENDLLAVDIFGPLPASTAGVKYILVILNVFTKYIKMYPIKTPTAGAITSKLEKDYFLNIRKPRSILSDNGSQFLSNKWNTFLKQNGIRNLHCSIRHPQSNPVERCMREIARLLRIYCHKKHTSWAKYVKRVELLLNCATHESTEAAPIFLEKGITPENEIRQIIHFPKDSHADRVDLRVVRERLLAKSEKRKCRHNTKNRTNYTSFSEGDLVWLKCNNLSSAEDREIKKFFLLFEGPYRIKQVVGHNAYSLENPKDGSIRGNFNVVSLKPYFS